MRLELTTYRLTAGRATDCAIQELHNTTRNKKIMNPKKKNNKKKKKKMGTMGIEPMTNGLLDQRSTD